jgi:hypothetical protein
MKSQNFIVGIRSQIIDANLAAYRELFSTIGNGRVKDPYWQQAGPFFATLSPEQKETFFLILRQVEVDTVSSFLAILDGVSMIDRLEGDFVLTTEANSTKINGNLQDIFLELEYE